MYLPKAIKNHLSDEKFERDDIGMSVSDVLIFDDYVLKIQEHTPETDNEAHIIKWLDGRIPVPRIAEYVIENGKSYTLMSKVRGKMLCDKMYMTDPAMLIGILADGLKMLWSVDISKCPCSESLLDARLKAARYNVEHGLVDVEDSEEGTFGDGGFRDPEALLSYLEKNRPEEDIVMTHGDYCLPNIIADDDEIKGFIDLGKAGPADRWQDIAICLRSLKHNFNGKYSGGEKYSGFEPHMLTHKLGIEMNEEKLSYYILLDELF